MAFATPTAFDEDTALTNIRTVLIDIVGDSLATIATEDGTEPAIIIAPLSVANEPDLPFLSMTYQGSNDNNGFKLDSGYVSEEITDPNDSSSTITTEIPYTDKFLNFSVLLRCEGDGAMGILRSVRNGIMSRYYLDQLGSYGITVEQITTARYTPDLIATEYRQIGTMLLSLNTIDRVKDYNMWGSFSTVSGTAHLVYKDDADTDVYTKDFSITNNS